MQQTFTLLLIFIFLPFLLIAQANYKKGFVVTSQGDMLRGFIDYREWVRNPEEVKFKSNRETKKNKSLLPI